MCWLHANVQVDLRVYVVNFVETKALGGSKIMGTAKLHTVCASHSAYLAIFEGTMPPAEPPLRRSKSASDP